MMSVDEIYELIKFVLNKNQQGYLPPSRFNLIINQAQRMYIAWLVGELQQYTPGRPISRVELGQNRTQRQRLSPVIYGYNLAIDPYGFSPYPGDFIQVDAMWSIYGQSIYGYQSIYSPRNKRIRYVQQNALDSFYNSSIDPITSNPIYLIEDLGFRFYPENQYTARLHYVRDAPPIEWAYTEDVNRRPVYDPVHSKQPVWDTASIFDIITRALTMAGVSLQIGQVIAYSEQKQKEGQ